MDRRYRRSGRCGACGLVGSITPVHGPARRRSRRPAQDARSSVRRPGQCDLGVGQVGADHLGRAEPGQPAAGDGHSRGRGRLGGGRGRCWSTGQAMSAEPGGGWRGHAGRGGGCAGQAAGGRDRREIAAAEAKRRSPQQRRASAQAAGQMLETQAAIDTAEAQCRDGTTPSRRTGQPSHRGRTPGGQGQVAVAEAGVKQAQAAYNLVTGDPQIGALPQSRGAQ